MTDPESIEIRLARIEEHVKSIDTRLAARLACCRHVTQDGECDFFHTVVDHDRQLHQWTPDVTKISEHDKKINQWTGALAAVALICSFIGSLIGFLLSKVLK